MVFFHHNYIPRNDFIHESSLLISGNQVYVHCVVFGSQFLLKDNYIWEQLSIKQRFECCIQNLLPCIMTDTLKKNHHIKCCKKVFPMHNQITLLTF